MSVKSLIDEILPYAPGFNRSGTRGLLTMIQRAQDLLFDYDGPYMRYFDMTNQGWPPFLLTTAGTYRYEITGANLSCGALTKTIGGVARTVRARRVMKIFVESTTIDYTRRWLGTPYLSSWVNPYTTSTNRLEVADVAVESEPALENTNAAVYFKEDPGTTTDVYFCEFVWEAPRLTSENIPFVVPLKYEEAIEDYVLGTIEKRQNGRSGERLQKFHEYWVPEFRQDITARGASTQRNQTVARVC